MTVQYLRALHSADFPRGREKGGPWLGREHAPHKDLGVAIGVKGRNGEVSSLDTAGAGVGSGTTKAKGEGAEEPVSAYTGSVASSQVGRGRVSLLQKRRSFARAFSRLQTGERGGGPQMRTLARK